MEYPPVSICMPIWNRNNFKELILFNLTQQSYPHDKLEFCVDDDGDDKFLKNKIEETSFKKLIHPIKLNYRYVYTKRSIGDKRNALTKQATHNIIATMDSDDLYLNDYIKNSVELLLKEKYTCVGSNQMIFLYPHHDWRTTAIRCGAKRQIHEACLVYTKKHIQLTKGFSKKSSQGEGAKMADFRENNVGLIDIDKCMVCIVHNGNTIDKEMFNKEDNIMDIGINPLVRDIIGRCLGIK